MPVTDILLGSATVWYAPLGEELPNADVIGYGVAWGGNWTALGYTLTPLSCLLTYEEIEVMVPESAMPVKRKRVNERISLETTMAKLTGDALALVTGGVVSLSQPAGGLWREELEAGNASPEERTWGFEGRYEADDGSVQPVRFQLYRATSTIGGAITFSKAGAAGIPLRVDGLGDVTRDAGKQGFKLQRVFPQQWFRLDLSYLDLYDLIGV